MLEFNPNNVYANASSQPSGRMGNDAPVFSTAEPSRPVAVSNTSLNLFKEDLELSDISDVTPQQLRQMGVKGVIFDMDDTLVPMGTGQVPPEAIAMLKNLQQSGIKVGIISNNPSDEYTANTKAQLAAEGLDIPMIKSATKPASDDFLAMADHMGLPPEQIAMVGDSRISDMIGGKMAGMKTIHADWYNPDGWQKARGVIGDIGSSFVSFFRELFGKDKPPEFVEASPAA